MLMWRKKKKLSKVKDVLKFLVKLPHFSLTFILWKS